MRAWEFDEASYEGNIGIMELMQFFKSAPPELVDRVKRLIDQGEKKQVWQIVQRHTGTKLQGAEFEEALDEVIRKVKGGYRLLSKKGKNLGTYPTKAGAEKRERQVQYFKHMGEDSTTSSYKPEWPFVDGYTKEGKQEHKLLDKPTPGIKELADKHGVDTKDIMRELTKGIKVELEHTSDAKVAREIALDHINELPDYYTRLAKVEESDIDEGPKDFANMKLDQKGKQDSIDYFYQKHAPTFGKPTKAGSFKGHNIVTFKTPDGTLMFLVNQNDQAVFYVGLNKMTDGVAVGNVRSNGTIKATEVYRYLVSKYGKLYSDKHQTPDGRKIWANLAKYNPELKISDTGDRLMATENFADGKVKGKSRPGRVKRAGASCKGSVSSLRAKAKKYSGERGKMYHWCANMKAGKKK